ncbi:MAG TPA: NAD(+) synthase, partial [Dehalococcoidales bacterium]|nr:NAD(+) synthase [Dehalococcoidales bacterium]
MRKLRLALAQINTTVGDFDGNVKKIIDGIKTAREAGANLVAFPELAVCGYPPEDLLFKPQFIKANLDSLKKIADATHQITAVVGFVDANDDIFNAAAVLDEGKIAGVYHKSYLPNYGVFDENRYFRQGAECPVFVIDGVKVGVTICEDIWYEAGPATIMADAGAEFILNISASPYHSAKGTYRERMFAARTTDTVAALGYCNAVGGQDELVFDGHSIIMNEHGEILARGKQFDEDMLYSDVDIESIFRTRLHDPRLRKQTTVAQPNQWPTSTVIVSEEQPSPSEKPIVSAKAELLSLPAEVYKALVVGTRDYIRKNGFKKVVIGLSGGIDSALVATIAVDALGHENVICVSMPSRYSSEHSKSDAHKLAENLKIKLLTIPIENVYSAYLETLSEALEGTKPDTTEENLQARIRGNLLMALS